MGGYAAHTNMANENYYNNMLAKAIRRMGIFAWRTSDRATAGLPDISTVRGIHIEGKVLPVPKRSLSIATHIDPAQKIFMNRLTKQGDPCFVSVYFVDEKGIRFFLLVPYKAVLEIPAWNIDDIYHFGVQMSHRLDFQLDRFFEKSVPDIWLADRWWKDRLADWKSLPKNRARWREVELEVPDEIEG